MIQWANHEVLSWSSIWLHQYSGDVTVYNNKRKWLWSKHPKINKFKRMKNNINYLFEYF